MDITSHPIWDQVTPYQTRISSYKKPLHLLRIFLAKQYAKLYDNGKFVGVTGSVGKTATVAACTAVLSQKYKGSEGKILTTKPNLDPILNIPETLLKMTPKVEKCILEMGIEYIGEMDFYLSLVKPKTAIVTKIAYAHSEFLGDISNIAYEKGKLIEQLPEDGVAILNWDDLESRKLSQKCKGNVVYFGFESEHCTVWADNIKIEYLGNIENFKTTFELNLGVERVQVNYKLLGRHQVYPALAAAALGVVFDVPLTKIKLALESVESFEHRMQPQAGPSGSIILDDTYNCSPSALEEALETLMQLPARRRVVVLGEMRELGEYSEKLHREIARKIYKEKIDMVFLSTGDTQFIASELQSLGFLEERIEVNLKNSQIVSKLLKTLGKGDVCLIKGSRAIRLDEVVKRIARKQ